ncbi:MAG: hypothetical protein JSR38_10310, partial [Proteobacteria bacterium]|nr:hypothetical protein [Pseudomonadota bacterium]
MSVRLRFTLLFGLLLLGFIAALAGLQWLEARGIQRDALALWHQREQQLDHWLHATGAALRDHTIETALAGPDAVPTPGDQVHPVADFTWIVRPDNSPAAAAPLPLSTDDLARWQRTPPPAQFFSATPGDGLLEICAQPLPAASAAPAGWVLAARQWDQDYLQLLASLTEGRVTLEHPSRHAVPAAGVAVHLRALRDWQGRPVRWLQVTYPAPPAVRWFEIHAPETALFFSFGLLLVVALALSLQRWVLQPLQQINTSLTRSEVGPITQLCTQDDELGSVARLIDVSFAQRNALRTEIAERQRTQAALAASEASLRETLAERTQLGRNLHDGVIQSLYATGMGLAGVRALLKPDQTEAATRLEQSRAALNETIHDVRNFITGLEPEALHQQSFAQAVAALLEFMRTIRPARFTCAIDEAVAARLTLAQRANLLHITREAVSNA